MNFFSHSLESPSLSKAAVVAPAVSPHTNEPSPGYKLTWCDEFDYRGQPDPAKWDWEQGYCRNWESQYYTDRAANARVEDGVLVIEAHKEKFAIPHRKWLAKYARYTSASLVTRAAWCFGRVEVRAKLPRGRGVWPAIWTLGAKGIWPRCGECDVLEYVGRLPDYVHARVHWGRLLLHRSSGSSVRVDAPWQDFHTYTMEWSRDEIAFYLDATCCHRFDVRKADRKDGNAFHQPHHLKLNLALGSWGGAIDNSILPQQFLVDYVRVFQKPDT